jgi:tetratricopeptide (TPR) repeat protein
LYLFEGNKITAMGRIEDLHTKSYRLLFYDTLAEYDEVIFKLKSVDAKNTHIYSNLGVAYMEIGELEEALIHFDLAIEANDRNAMAFICRAETNRKLKRYAQAEADYGRAIDLDPTDITSLRSRAYFFKETGQLKKALSDFRKAAGMDPDFQPTLNEIKALENK